MGKNLADHLVLEKFLFVEDFDGDVLVRLNVPSELDLGEISLPKSPTELVLPHARPAAAAIVAVRPRRHLLLHSTPPNPPSHFTLSLYNPFPSHTLSLKPLRSRPLLLAGLPNLRLCHTHLPPFNSKQTNKTKSIQNPLSFYSLRETEPEFRTQETLRN